MKITINDYYDGFDIVIEHDGEETVFNFNQEDDKERLVEVFKRLGYDVTYNGDC